jgi:uncharacterized protein
MIRVVLDTNIVMSALLNPRGAPAQVFLMIILEPDTQVCVSGDIFAEYEDVLRRPRFSRSDGDIQAALRTIREKALWVKPLKKYTPVLILTTTFFSSADKHPQRIT